ncbi:hypothetical protein FRB94_006055 [Tulasnella sp. JGI-2019a]|nr:hypothetical protein FRB93_001015 [Tulasnella sp. JGI-2019a]KAG9012440.1 hypothetical protein FRB94_006055 [Tulasnella sp. JGI-2019a]KAG9031487.1 hypothetical protein FRB95_002675 [Tulasnella sp. JGI-2019a]
MPRVSPSKSKPRETQGRDTGHQSLPLKTENSDNADLPFNSHEHQVQPGAEASASQLNACTEWFPEAELELESVGGEEWEVRFISKSKEDVAKTFESIYELQEPLEEGGCGQVFRVRELGTESADSMELACKIVNIPIEYSDPNLMDVREKRAWAREVAILANELNIWEKLNHPHLVRLLRCIKEGEHKIFCIMQFATEGSLADYPVEQLCLGEVLQIVAQIMDGIIYMHDKEIMHLDLKPTNVLLTDDGEGIKAMVADFGISHQGLTHNVSVDGVTAIDQYA